VLAKATEMVKARVTVTLEAVDHRFAMSHKEYLATKRHKTHKRF
jgi:hypothetical protein